MVRTRGHQAMTLRPVRGKFNETEPIGLTEPSEPEARRVLSGNVDIVPRD